MAKTVYQKEFAPGASIPSYFDKSNVDATIRDQSYDCIFEKAYFCPCKSNPSTPLSTCKNCGGTGWIFPNAIETRFIITGIAADNKLKEAALREWGMIDMGSVNVTGLNDEKFTYMDRITMLDATAENNQVLYPILNDDDTNQFAFTQYKIKSVDYLAAFVSADEPLKKLEEGVDYTFRSNVIELDPSYNDINNIQLTIRYVHNPAFHITDIIRESMTSKKGQLPTGQETLIMPIKAIARRAHLVKDVENYEGNRINDNSWLPNTCKTPDISAFQRQIRYSDAQTIFNFLTAKQKQDLNALLG